jgi:hypothetical protein
MLKVGLLTPYVRNEVTLAATQFADWLTRCGIDVAILSDSKIESGIHPVWDKRVKRAHRKNVYAWAYGSTHLCWFSANSKALQWSRLVGFDKPKFRTKHYFFPYWSHWPDRCDNFLRQSDRVICLNQDLFNWLKEHRRPNILEYDRTWANLLPAEQVLVPKHGRVSKDQTYLMALLTSTTHLDLGEGILDVFDFLLTTRPDLWLTVVLEKSLPRNYRAKLSRLGQVHRERLTVVHNPPYYAYSDLARRHDWVYVANTRHLFGSLIYALLPSTVPLICHDVPPVGAHIQDNNNGRLIPCEVHDDSAPIAGVSLDVVGNYLDEILDEPSIVLKALQLTGVELFNKRQTAFERFINKEFIE